MKILQVVFFYDPATQYGGPTVNVRNLSNHFTKRGHEVTIYCTNYLNYKDKMSSRTFEKINNGIKVVYFDSHRLLPAINGKHGLIACPDLLKKYDSDISTHDVVHINGYRNFLALMIARKAKKLEVPYILQARGTLKVLSGSIYLKKIFDFMCGRNILRNAARVIALTAYEKELYMIMGVNSENIEIIPNGLEIEEIQSKIKPGQFRERLGIPLNEKIILFLGRIHQTKGVELLIKAFAKAKLKNTRLVIVGPDEGCLQSAQRTISNLELPENAVMFPGPIYGDDKFTAYYDADVFVRCSFVEGLPMGVIESLICGTPVIISRQCGIDDVIDQKVGIVVESNEDMLSMALNRIIKDDALQNYFKKNTKDIVRGFEIHGVVEQIERLYSSLKIEKPS